jgi:signal transduction histidine kinase
MGILHFESSTNLKDLIGRRLVTNKISAIFELVKNSFDADAEEVLVEIDEDNDRLIIMDNGSGMSLQDIEKKWMLIGTDNKKGKNVSTKGRPLNGEKGIGRFSVDRLGSKLTLISSIGEQNKTVKVEFDWEFFEDQEGKKLGEVPVYYTFLKARRKKGVKLIISGLRDAWGSTEVQRLEKKLRGLLSPFSNLDNFPFKIILHSEKYGYNKKLLEPYSLNEISSLWIDFEITKEDTGLIRYSIYRNGALIDEREYENPYTFGPVKMTLYSFDKGDKTSFRNRFNESVKDFGSIRIYRDFFQIYPYGEPGNDWLNLDIRKSQGHFRFLGVRDLIGYIQIFREHNDGFIDATNRQGLVENEALQQLRDFIHRDVMSKLEEYFFLKKNKNTNNQHKVHREEITSAAKSLKIIAKEISKYSPSDADKVIELTKLIQKTNQEQDKIIRDQQEIVDVYKRMSSKETLLHGIIHQVLIRMANLQTAIYNQKFEVEEYDLPDDTIEYLDQSFDFLLKTSKEISSFLLDARDHLLKKREKTKVELSSYLKKVFNDYLSTLLSDEITYTIDGPEKTYLNIDINDFKVIFENLISNSRKSLRKVKDRKRKIEVNFQVNNNSINFLFKDNGIGIPKDEVPHVFTPFYTTHDDGFGMGLAIVDELVQTNNGEINLVIPKENEFGATFQVSFRI